MTINHQEGLVIHTAGWPLGQKYLWRKLYVYHAENKQIYIGYVIGLDYQNPYICHHLMNFKDLRHIHAIKNIMLEGGKRISYGARALIEGGFQSLPKNVYAWRFVNWLQCGNIKYAKNKRIPYCNEKVELLLQKQ